MSKEKMLADPDKKAVKKGVGIRQSHPQTVFEGESLGDGVLYPLGPGLKAKAGNSDQLLPVFKKPKKVAATVVLSCKKCRERCHRNSF